MRPVITPEESARLDSVSPEPVSVLMERAGLAVALAAVRLGAGYGSRVAVLAGPGNNGGDGYVAARYLARRGAAVTVYALGPPREGTAAATAAAAAAAAGIGMRLLEAPPARVDLIIDALFGAGFRGQLPEAAEPWIQSAAPVVAVDVASGLSAADGTVSGPAFTAATTVTFHALKVGHLVGEGPERSGDVVVADIGLSGEVPALRLTEAADAAVPTRERTAHKWAAGSVLVAGGSTGLTGAPLLAAQAALVAGAGAVTIACPGELQPLYAAMTPGVMTFPVGHSDRFEGTDAVSLLGRAERYDVLLLGPGLGPNQEKLVAGILEGREGRLLIDADGIGGIGDPQQLVERRFATLSTPHAGEFRRLTGRPATLAAARELAATTGTVVTLKGNPTFVFGDEQWVVTSGGPELATIGTGDVLAGMIAAFWARGLDAERAARAGAYWHGVAGARGRQTGRVTAENLVHHVERLGV